MERFSKNTKGITLIALVVTIIVLLILAAVSLSLVAGESGILSRAEKATNETVRGAAKEEVQLELADLLSIYYEEKYPNHNASLAGKTAGEYIKENADGTTTSGYTYSIGTVDKDGNYIVTVNDKQGNQVATGRMTKEGKLSLGDSNSSASSGDKKTEDETKTEDESGKTVANAIEATNYGDEVTNYTANGISDWRIFYKDGTNTYLIASDYVPITQLGTVKTKAGMTTTGTYQAYWDPAPSAMQEGWNTQKNKYLLSKYTSSWDTNNNMKAVSTLLNTENWTEFKDSTGYVDWVIGGPTLEMYTASWNAKGYTALYCDNANDAGYYVGTSATPTSYSVNMSSTEGYNDTLYYPHKSVESNCYGYWLASPSAGSNGCVMNVDYNGNVSYNYYNSTLYGVRPVVSLKSDVKLTGTTTDGKTTWTLSK